MGSKIINGYCEEQKCNYSVDINILESHTLEDISRNYGTYKCDYKAFGNKCNQPECSILRDNGIKIGTSL